MLGKGRILVGLNGCAPDEHVIRYVSMVARIGQSAARNQRQRATSPRSAASKRATTLSGADRVPLWGPQVVCDEPEIRFVALSSHSAAGQPLPRAELTAKVRNHFRPPPCSRLITFDLLKGRGLERLPALAADFESDLILLEQASGSRARCARLALAAPCAVWLVPTAWAPVMRRILVPIDFSTRSAASVRVAISLASRFPPAKCLALYVDGINTRFGGGSVSVSRQHELSDEFAVFMRAIDPCGVSVEPIFVQASEVGRAVGRATQRYACDLIVLTARCRSRLASAMHPSLAETIIRRNPGPTLLMKSGANSVGFLDAFCERWQTAETPLFS